ncbi:MAG: hypothetical protein ACJA2O_003826 [Candidatus Azotimanducaceae bacterium]|jgi:hypothetical protein
MNRMTLFLILVCGQLSVPMLSFAEASIPEKVILLKTPSGENTSLSRLVSDAKGELHLSWVKTTGDHQGLYYSTLNELSWSPAKLIAEGDNWFVNWADFPSLVVNQNSMTAHWLQMRAEGTYDYDVRASFFDSVKQIWGEDIVVHKDGVNAEHGFVSMLPMADDNTFITWLDGRLTKTKDDRGELGGMTLRAGVFDRRGNIQEDWLLDELTCDCCQTNAAMTDVGPVVVYRDRTIDEVRDIYITRLENNVWSKPVAVSHDNWVVAGCPVNGPDVSAKNGLMVVSWFSAKNDRSEVKLAYSHDAGKTFGEPVVVAQNSTNGRVGVTILDSGIVAATWLETENQNAKIMVAYYGQNTTLLSSFVVAETKSSRRSGFPMVESIGDDVYLTWTDISGSAKVNVAKIPLPAGVKLKLMLSKPAVAQIEN